MSLTSVGQFNRLLIMTFVIGLFFSKFSAVPMVDVPGTLFNRPSILQTRPLHTLPGFFENGPKNNFTHADSWKSKHGFNFSITAFLNTSFFVSDDSKFLVNGPLNKSTIDTIKNKLLLSPMVEEYYSQITNLFDSFYGITTEFHTAGFVFGIQKSFDRFRILFSMPVSVSLAHPFSNNISQAQIQENRQMFQDLGKMLADPNATPATGQTAVQSDGSGLLSALVNVYAKLVVGGYVCVDFQMVKMPRLEVDLNASFYGPLNNKSVGDWKFLEPNRPYLSSPALLAGSQDDMANQYVSTLQGWFDTDGFGTAADTNNTIDRLFYHFASIAQAVIVSRLSGPVCRDNASVGVGLKFKLKLDDDGAVKLFDEFKVNLQPCRKIDWLIFSRDIYEPSLTNCTVSNNLSVNNRVGFIIGQKEVSLKIGYDFYNQWGSDVNFAFGSFNSPLGKDLADNNELSNAVSSFAGCRAHKAFWELNWNLGGSRVHGMLSFGGNVSLASQNVYNDLGAYFHCKFEY